MWKKLPLSSLLNAGRKSPQITTTTGSVIMSNPILKQQHRLLSCSCTGVSSKSTPLSRSIYHNNNNNPLSQGTSAGYHHPGVVFSRSIFLEPHDTPSTLSKKFYPIMDESDRRVRPGPVLLEKGSMDLASFKDAQVSPLAVALFRLEGVNRVFLTEEYVTVTVSDEDAWKSLTPHIYATFMDWFASNMPLLTEERIKPSGNDITEEDDDIVALIKELLETRIRPFVQEDGGDIEFKRFDENGIVHLQLQGACSSCSSSEATLKGGVENMLTHYIPEVKGVEQVYDERDEVADEALRKLEEKLGDKERD